MGATPFVKIQGAGNDFIFVDLRKSTFASFSALSRAEFVARVCDRHHGVGADGLVFVEESHAAEVDLQWDFYNTDGSFAEMCGNAARCMGLWAVRHASLSTLKFTTRAGTVRAEMRGSQVAVDLDFVQIELKDICYAKQGQAHTAVLVNTGVPHAVVEVKNIDELHLFSEDITALRFHPEAGERGANVTFLQRGSDLRTVTFERGVEDFTLACGTGVLAAASVALRDSGYSTAELKTPGGLLQVELKVPTGARLIGEARFVFEGEVDADEIKTNKGGLK